MRGARWRNLANTIQPSMFGGPAKTAEPIEMPFVMWTRVSLDHPMRMGQF